VAGSLLELLRRDRGQWFGVEALRIALNLEQAQIHCQIEALGLMGHRIESAPVDGFRWLGCQSKLNTDLLACGLRSQRVGRKLLVYQSAESTNDIAWLHVEEEGFDGLAIFAESQREGRGRLGRSWSGGVECGLLCSILLQRYGGPSEQGLSLLPSLALAEAVEQSLGVSPNIKWPNDLMVDHKKLAGTMVEARMVQGVKCYVLGIGINCLQARNDFSAELQDHAISLKQLVGDRVDRVYLAQLFMERLDRWLFDLEKGEEGKLHDAWIRYCDMTGGCLTVVQNGQEFTGRMIDVAVDKGLVLQLESGPVKVFDAATTSVK
jgi:BirA family biotin operon repressor/biotin-[acetyl-CoA-carboxylase] ligase